MRKGLVCALAVVLALLAGPGWAGRVVKLGHVAPPFHGQHQGLLKLAEVVKQETGGQWEVKVFPLGQLGGERSMAEQVQMGTLQVAAITTAVLSNFVPQAAALDLPFLWPDRKTAYAVLDDPEFQKEFFKFFEPKGFVAIGFAENEFRHLTNSKRPVRRPEDLKGLKLRLMEAPIFLDTFKLLGATPVPMPFPEVYNALQQGVIDGQDNPLLTSVLMKFTEVNKYVTLLNHTLTETVIVVNADFWNSLPPDVQKAFRKGARECIRTNRAVNAALYKKLPKLGISVEEYCKKNGIQVIDLTADERAAFRKAVNPIYDKYRAQIGPGFMDFLLSKVKEHQGK
ncbi:TRAP transporter substrate-binding protein DctP [Deferrisoma camini]|uniref:TRAP transporter substrate-binding protein DctP n=1 Tax=Deferrisoma camini TaxID=1035120 RepID=UPI00046D2DA7|nr:TRAP transporter substrate-binding protein DctP [Deferrisoma camini]